MYNIASPENNECTIGDPPCRGLAPCTDADHQLSTIMLVDIVRDDDTTQIARIKKDDGDACPVNFLEKRSNSTYCFSIEDEVVTKDTISGYYDVDQLEDTGLFIMIREGVYTFYDEDEDSDFVCSENSETDDSISLEDDEM